MLLLLDGLNSYCPLKVSLDLARRDEDLLRETKRRQLAGEHFAGVVYAQQLNITIVECIGDLELIAKATGPDDWHDRVMFLPL